MVYKTTQMENSINGERKSDEKETHDTKRNVEWSKAYRETESQSNVTDNRHRDAATTTSIYFMGKSKCEH